MFKWNLNTYKNVSEVMHKRVTHITLTEYGHSFMYHNLQHTNFEQAITNVRD
jgi:hypothetical protein